MSWLTNTESWGLLLVSQGITDTPNRVSWNEEWVPQSNLKKVNEKESWTEKNWPFQAIIISSQVRPSSFCMTLAKLLPFFSFVFLSSQWSLRFLLSLRLEAIAMSLNSGMTKSKDIRIMKYSTVAKMN